VLAGRVFTEQETPDTSRAVVIDQALATAVFGRQPALGQRLYRSARSGASQPWEVIGVVANSGGRELRGQHVPVLYRPAGTLSRATFQVRSPLPEAEATALVQRVIRGIEPALPVDSVMSLRDHVAQITAQERLLAKLGSILAALALAIAVAGIYSAVACRVAEQTRELGIRLALGASQRTVGLAVLRRVLVLATLGTAVGLALYGWGARFIEAWLYGISSLDAATLGGATALSLLATLAAAWLPVRRATRVDPTIAMRVG
jgi:predicted lysophospholipase L1 biosynthesis ABC-type transport system permease subunit